MAGKNREVDAYIEGLAQDRREALRALRDVVFEVVPDAVETMRYRMPTYDYHGFLCAFASQKHYVSLYVDPDLVEKHRGELGHLNLGKGCIRFKRLEDLPLSTVRAILQGAADQVRG